jgi:hypothetical protein
VLDTMICQGGCGAHPCAQAFLPRKTAAAPSRKPDGLAALAAAALDPVSRKSAPRPNIDLAQCRCEATSHPARPRMPARSSLVARWAKPSASRRRPPPRPNPSRRDVMPSLFLAALNFFASRICWCSPSRPAVRACERVPRAPKPAPRRRRARSAEILLRVMPGRSDGMVCEHGARGDRRRLADRLRVPPQAL